MKHGTFIADMAYLNEMGKYIKVGALMYFRSDEKPEAKFRVDRAIPVGNNIIGLFLAKVETVSGKFQEAPFVDGDLYAMDGRKRIKVGHIHSEQNEIGETIYWARFTTNMAWAGFPVWVRIDLE